MLNTQEVLKRRRSGKSAARKHGLYRRVPRKKLHMSFSESRRNCLIQEGALLLRARLLSHQYQETWFSTVKIEVLSKLLAFIDGAGLVDTTHAEIR